MAIKYECPSRRGVEAKSGWSQPPWIRFAFPFMRPVISEFPGYVEGYAVISMIIPRGARLWMVQPG